MSDETNDRGISRRARVVGDPYGDGRSAAQPPSRELGDETEELDEVDDVEAEDPGQPGRGRSFLLNVWGGIKEIVIIAVMAMVLSFVVKTWLIQAFYIPSGSMEDTLVKDDRVIVSKLTPGPVDLARGDVVVFQDPDHWLGDLPTSKDEPGIRGALHRGLQFIGLLPDDSDDHLIKRVIGLPGDQVVCCDKAGAITVNGVAVTETYVKQGDTPSGGRPPFSITVPAGRVWVMGDHRSDSSDSRFHDDGTGATGSVPIQDITGRAVMVVWPIDNVTWLSVPSRIFETVPSKPATTPGGTNTPATTPSGPPAGIPTKAG
jgi:signal peptidase I